MSEITIILKKDLDAHASAKLVHIASQFISGTNVENRGIKVDAKSIMGVITLIAKQGDEIKFTANGIDEIDALKTIENHLNEE